MRAQALPHLEELAKQPISTEFIIEEIERLRSGRTRFVDGLIAYAAEPEVDVPEVPDFLRLDADDGPNANLPHSAHRSPRRRLGVRK